MARRPFTVFSLSFLDVMACGLGATILFLVIMSTQVRQRAEAASAALLAEASALEQKLLEARKRQLALSDSPMVEPELEDPAAEIARIRALIAALRAQLEERNADSTARKDSVEQLRADIKRLEEAKSRLSAAPVQAASGGRTRSFVGEGSRQYLTGIRMGGQRVLFLVDGSASMMARTYVNVVRFRAMPEARRRTAPKWRQALRTTDWLTAQMLPGSRFQMVVFNETARSVVAGTDGTWLEASEGGLDKAVAALRQHVPGGGTSLLNAFEVIRKMSPAPDNIFLITDGLPTVGRSAPAVAESVRAEKRMKYFSEAAQSLSSRIPVNVILFPMDGDPAAAGQFWQLAYATRGSFITPARDWP
jgi:hypothetical protein